MLGIDIARVSIESRNISNNDKELVQKIVYRSSTKSVADIFFPVSNYHETVISGSNILQYKKDINQTDYKEKSATYRRNDTTFYSLDKFACKDCHNIFSLLNLAQQNPYSVLNNEFIIDREGETFKANFILKSKINNILTLWLNIDLVSSQNYIIRKNDIFLWGIFLPNCERLISIDLNSNKIVKCQFNNRLINLEANLLE